MKIRTTAWHYKWVARYWDSHPKALCWYFWKVIISIIGRIGQGGLILLAACIALVIITYPVWHWFASDWHETPMVLSFFVWTMAGYVALKAYRSHLYHSGQLIPPKPKPRKEPGLLAQFLTAKHRKVCPLLEYTDD